ncbi:MAG: lysophospholipid acyltransferase family protein [Ignavibacteriaceae bacterium]
MKLKKLKQDTLRFTGQIVLYNLINVLCKTLRITIKNKNVIDELDRQNQKYILAFWHGTMLLPWFVHRDRNFTALISKSKDGDLLANILKKWNYDVIRGSSSTGGEVALGIMIDYARNGYSVSVTPDGPRGPEFKMKAGAVITAKKSGLPLVLAGVGFNKKRKLKSWDKFQIPKFFSRAVLFYSEPVHVDKNLDYDQTSAVIKKCEEKLNELQQKAEVFEVYE